MAPHGNFLQHSLKTTSRWQAAVRTSNSSASYWRNTREFFGKWAYLFAGRDFRVGVALSSREPPVENYTWIAFRTTDLSLEWIISIVPEMDGNILHDLLAARVRAGRRFSSGPLACLLTCSWVLVNIQGALTWKTGLAAEPRSHPPQRN